MKHDKYAEIEVEFKNGEHAVYTKAVLHLLMTDDFVRHIVDLKTGELLK